MIKLNIPYTTTVQYLSGTQVVDAVTTDTLFVRKVTLDFSTGAMYAEIDRGTLVNGVFASNYPSLDVTVNPDGSFISSDGSWHGTVASAPALVAQLKGTFDQFILVSGSVTGTTE